MKTIKFLLVAFFLLVNIFANATTNPLDKKEDLARINKEVKILLKNPKIELESNISVIVKLMVNSKNEIIVLSVNSKNEIIDSYIKSSLNYRKIAKRVKSEVYSLPVKLVSKI